MLFFFSADSLRNLLPSSSAALICAAFANPIPPILQISEIGAESIALSDPNLFNNLLASSSALAPSFPVRRIIARIFDSERDAGPYFISISVGLSSFTHFLIGRFSLFSATRSFTSFLILSQSRAVLIFSLSIISLVLSSVKNTFLEDFRKIFPFLLKNG